MLRSVVIFSLAITFFLSATFAFAQEVNDGTYNTSPGNTVNDTQGGGVVSDTAGFDWRWLLPLLAIPVVLLFLGEKKEDEFTRYYDQPLAGAKGGKTKRKKSKKK